MQKFSILNIEPNPMPSSNKVVNYYYTFGSLKNGRNFSVGSGYRFGFNGMEKDDEIMGSGNHISFNDYGLDTRLGKRWNLDPKIAKYPSQSNYIVFDNSPIYNLDITGEDAISYLEVKKGKTTLVIKADYHFIKNEFNNEVLKAVQKEYSSFKRIKFNGHKIKVRFEIGFIEHNENDDLTLYDGKDGQNALSKKSIADPRLLEESNFKGIDVDVDGINGSKSTEIVPDNGEKVSLNSKDKFDKQISVLSHGIGHNIGLIHDDYGIMNEQIQTIYQNDNPLDPKIKNYSLSFTQNHLTKSNVQTLCNRILEMTDKNRNYWDKKVDKDKNDLNGIGITTMVKK